VFIGRTLMVMALGLVPYSLHYLVIRSFYALEDTRTPFFVQATIVAANIVLAIALVVPFQASGWVAAGLGGAYALAYVVGLAVAVPLLRRRLPDLDFRGVLAQVGRLTVATIPAGLLAWLIMRFTGGHGQLALLGSLVLAGGVAVGTFLVMARTLHIEEVSEVVAAITRRKGTEGPRGVDAAPSRMDEQEESVVPDTTSEDRDPASVIAAPDRQDPRDGNSPIGRLLGGRFRIEEQISPDRSDLWRATDLTLKRSVVCQFFPPEDERGPVLLAAAKRAAQVTDARFVRILDFSDGTQPYVVREYAPGLTLTTLLADGPLNGVESAWLVRELADALTVVHGQGRGHHRLNPDAVIVTDTGNVKILGFQIDEVLLPPDPSTSVEDPEAADVFDLGRLLYACLTGYWPGGPAYGLADAPTRGAMWLPPRSVRSDVSPGLDRITQQVLGGGSPMMANTTGRPVVTTAAGVVAALSSVLGVTDASYRLEQRVRHHRDGPQDPTMTQDPVPAPASVPEPLPALEQTVRVSPPPEPPLKVVPRQRPNRGWVVGLLVLIAVAIVVGLIGVAINSGRDNAGAPLGGDPKSPSTAAGGPWAVVDSTTFDPSADGGNGDENPNTAALAHDGDPTTGWRTMTYVGNPELGNLKPGVGLILDLGETRPIGTVTAEVLGNGSTIEVRVPNDPTAAAPPMDSATSWQVLAKRTEATGSVDLVVDPAVESRFVMLYLTRLAPDGDGFRGGIDEVQVGP